MTRVPLPHDLRYHFRTRSPASPLRQLGGARIGTLVMAEIPSSSRWWPRSGTSNVGGVEVQSPAPPTGGRPHEAGATARARRPTGHAGGQMVPRVDRGPVGRLRSRCPARAAGPGHRALRPRRCRPRMVGGLLGLDLGLAHGHLGDDDLHGPGWRLRRPRRRLRRPLPAQPQADAHRGRGPSPYRGGRRPLRRRTAALLGPRLLGPVHPGSPRGRGVQPEAVASA